MCGSSGSGMQVPCGLVAKLCYLRIQERSENCSVEKRASVLLWRKSVCLLELQEAVWMRRPGAASRKTLAA